MTGAVLLTQGDLGESLVAALELIAGPQEQVRTVGLRHGDDVDEFETRFRTAMAEVDTGEGVMVFVDFYGGTPSNVAMRCLQHLRSTQCALFPCVAGVNLPMLAETLTNRDVYPAEKLEAVALEAGASGVVRLSDKLDTLACGTQNDF